MFKKTLSLIVAALFALTLALPAFAAVSVPVRYDTPEGYNDHDYQKIVAFLETEVTKSLMGTSLTKTNGYWVFGDSYDPADPETWSRRISWVEEGGELRLCGIQLDEPIYYGEAGGVLDVSNCTALTYINCDDNWLEGLDASNCTALQSLRCMDNHVAFLNAAGCTGLGEIVCRENYITSLDITGCTALSMLNCAENELTELDLSSCGELGDLYCRENPITELDLSACPYLFYLSCGSTSLTELDLSANTLLVSLGCAECGLTELDLSANTALESLWCSDNPLTELDLSANTALAGLDCDRCQLTELDLTANTALERIECYGCPLTRLDVHGLASLQEVWCDNTPLASVDVTGCTMLCDLRCRDAFLTSIELSDSRYMDMPLVNAEGDGGFGIVCEPFSECKTDFANDGVWYELYAHPAEGAEFLGWYAENGELVSEEPNMSREIWADDENPWAAYGVLTARFTGGAGVPGDMDGDGECTIADAVLALRAGMGLIEATAEQVDLCDIDGDGEITVADALLIMRAAMGLINLD